MRKFTRAEFIFEPIKAIATAMNPKKEDNVDTAVEFGSEIALVAAGLWVAYEGGKDKLVSVQPTPVRTLSEDDQFIQNMNAETAGLMTGLGEVLNTASQLEQSWRGAYLKSRTVLVTKYDSDNEPYLSMETEYYWDEPDQLTAVGLNRGTLSRISSSLITLNNAMVGLSNQIPSAASIHLDGGDSYRFDSTEIDLSSRNTTATLGLGSSAAIFAFYEEIYTGLMQKGNYRRVKKLADKAIKRRSFLKLGLGSTALIPTAQLHTSLVSENAVVERRVKADTSDALNQYGSINDLDLFQHYFGNSIDVVLQQLDDYFAIIDTAVDTGNGQDIKSWDNVSGQLTTLRSQLKAYKTTLRTKLQLDGESVVPENLALGMRNLTTHVDVIGGANSINNNPGKNAFIQVLTFAGLLCGVAFTSEALIAAQDEVTKIIEN